MALVLMDASIQHSIESGRTKDVLSRLKQDIYFDINVRTVYQSTMLHLAARHGHVELAAELLKEGADLHSLDYGALRRTPLAWATHQGHMAMVELLVDAGANPHFWCSQDHLENSSKCIKRSTALELALYRPPWQPNIHYMWPPKFKAAVAVLLQASSFHKPSLDSSGGLALSILGLSSSSEEGETSSSPLVGWALARDETLEIVKRMAYPISAWM